MASLTLNPRRDGARFTLRGVFRDSDSATNKQRELTVKGMATILFKEEAPSGATLTHVGARHDVDRGDRAGIPHEHTTPWDAVRVAMDRFRRIERAAQRKGLDFAWYKPLDLDDLKAVIESWHWDGTSRQVAGDILTKTIRAHPFPNANHRTSLNLAIVYFDAVGLDWPPYSRRGRGIRRYHDEIKPFIHESKYLLQELRHQAMIEVAWEEGYEVVEFSDGSTAEIREADVSASRSELQDKHRRSSERLVARITADKDQSRLDEANPIGLTEWVEEGLG